MIETFYIKDDQVRFAEDLEKIELLPDQILITK
jgi:hypothetical protein